MKRGDRRVIIVAFTGMDGAGKTTVARRLIKKLHQLSIGSIYVHGFHNPFLSFIVNSRHFRKFFSSCSLGSSTRTTKSRNVSKQNKTILLIFWHIAVFIETIVFFYYLKLIKSHRKLIIFDRFWTDRYAYLIASSRTNLILDILYKKVYPVLVRPDFIVYFRVDPFIAYKRKKNEYHTYTLDFLGHLAKSYNYVISTISLKLSIVVVDSSEKNPEEITMFILKRLIMRSLNKMLPLIKSNRTEHRFLSLIKDINTGFSRISIIRDLEQEANMREETYLKFLKMLDELSKEYSHKFVVYKSYVMGLKAVPRDLDVIAEDIREFVRTLIYKLVYDEGKLDIVIQRQKDKPWEITVAVSKSYKVEVSPAIISFSYTFIPKEIIFNNLERMNMNGYTILTLSRHLDFLARCVHAVFEHFYLRYDEYLHILNLLLRMKKRDIDYMYRIASLQYWEEAFVFFLSWLVNIYRKYMQINRLRNGLEISDFPINLPHAAILYLVIKILMRNSNLKMNEKSRVLLFFAFHFIRNLLYNKVINVFFYGKTYGPRSE